MARLTMVLVWFVYMGCPALFAQIPGKAIQFVSLNDYVAVADGGQFDFNTSFSVEARVRPLSLGGPGPFKAILQGAFSEPPSSGGGWVLFLDQTDYSSWGLSVCTPGCDAPFSGPGGLQLNIWQHVAATYDGSRITLYKDGVPIAERTHSGDVTDVNFVLVGIWDEAFRGEVDEVRIWNVVRTQAQIQLTMGDTLSAAYYTTSDSGLVGYWRFDGDANDLSVFAAHGIIHGDAHFVAVPPTGDVNCDGCVDLADVVLLGNVIDGLANPRGTCVEFAGDVDGDGLVATQADYVLLYDRVAGGGSVAPWPLKVGNEWVSEAREFDSAGNVLNVDTTAMAVAKDTLIGNERWYIITVNGFRDPEVPILANRSDGLWAGGPSGALFAKYPAAVNDTFLVGSEVVVVESVHDTVTVPAGTFVCYRYKWPEPPTSDRPYQLRYLSPGFGFIKGVEYRKTAGGYVYPNLVSELILYKLN